MASISSRLRYGRLLVSKAKRRAKTIERRLTRIFVIDLLFRTVKEMSDDDATHMAAGVAYYALFSLFPLLLGLIAVFSYFIDSSPGEGNDLATEGVTRFVSEYLPGSETFVSENLEILLNLRGAATVVAALGMFWSASAVFGALSRAVNRAWDVHQDPPFYLNKTRQLLMAVGVACLFLLSFGAATLVRAAGLLGDLDAPQVSFIVNQNRHGCVADDLIRAGAERVPVDLQVHAEHYHLLALHLAGRVSGRVAVRGDQEPVHNIPQQLRQLRRHPTGRWRR